MVAGLVSSLVLICLSLAVFVGVLHFSSAPFPLQNPALVSVPIGLLADRLMSRLTARTPALVGRLGRT